MIFCKQHTFSDIYLTKFDGLYIMVIRSNPPETVAFHNKKVLIDKLCQLQVEGKRVPDYVFGLLEEE